MPADSQPFDRKQAETMLLESSDLCKELDCLALRTVRRSLAEIDRLEDENKELKHNNLKLWQYLKTLPPLPDPGPISKYPMIADAAIGQIKKMLSYNGDLEVKLSKCKEALIEREARRIYPFNMPRWEKLPDEDHRAPGFGGIKDRRGKKFYRDEAKEGLAQEYPWMVD